MTQAQVLYVPDLAKLLGKTEASIRSAVNRGGADWLPPRMNTTRLQWYRPTVDAFLQALDPTTAKPAKKAGGKVKAAA